MTDTGTRARREVNTEFELSARQPTSFANPTHWAGQPRVNYNRRRIFTKEGDIDLIRLNIEKRCRRYFGDFFTTLLDLGWGWILSFLVLSFVLSWLIFAGIWLLIMKIHGDFSDDPTSATRIPCVAGVTTFAGVILFSIETQQTIGYGTRSVTQQCASGVALLMIQSCVGLILQALWVGIVYTKLARPKKRRRTLMWSRQAVIAFRKNNLILQVRIADMRQRSTLLEAHIRMYFVSKHVTQEEEEQEEMTPLNLVDMDVGFDVGRDRLLLIWPLTIEHRIDSKSPLWLMDKKKLEKGEFEILVVFEGIIESTGLTTQARTSYTPNEIIWGARFNPIIRFDPLTHFTVDFSKFNSITPDRRTKDCSAKQLQNESER
ncbi:unnamed protein product [Rotaria magnacalcarata]|uniref:Uncharacterized protein n=2 Tax=Rotaria magnacalcarata TaxID=392030 RepID=A0A816S5U5_9BILA|nr:unnamed protein product [Rotaria magnacalcarata]